jgi:hypothetical protein
VSEQENGSGGWIVGEGAPAPSPASGAAVEVVCNLGDVYDVSDGLIDHLSENKVEMGLGIFALVLTVGRCLAPREMTPEDEQAFIKNTLDFIGASFAQGSVN